MPGSKPILFLLFLVACFDRTFAATCTSTGNGNWATNATWSCGHVPTCGDSVIIQSGHTLTITSQQDLRGCGSNLVLVVYGTLKFTTGNKLRLACDSRVYIFTGGSLVPGGGGGSSNELEVCGATMWQASDGTYTGPGCFPSTLTACAKVLPIELLFFKEVECETESVCLSWRTASEHNNNFYEVERSLNAIDFESLARINSKAAGGNSFTGLDYEFTDSYPFNGLFYYRLKQVDYSLAFSYSDIVAVNYNKNTFAFSVFPNPNTGQFFYKISGVNKANSLKMVLVALGGEPVFEKTIYASTGNVKGEIELGPEIKPGFYLCYLYSGSNKLTTKIVVNK